RDRRRRPGPDLRARRRVFHPRRPRPCARGRAQRPTLAPRPAGRSAAQGGDADHRGPYLRGAARSRTAGRRGATAAAWAALRWAPGWEGRCRRMAARMSLTVWGRLSSINVQKVMWALDEIGLAYEHVPAGGSFGLLDTPEFKAMNPHGWVPVIDDDGAIVWES